MLSIVVVSQPSDAELLARWQQGDAKAGETLAARYFTVLRAYFLSKAPHDYEDLVATTLLRLVHKRDRFRGDSSFRVYLLGMARMVLLEHFRARKRDERFEAMESSVIDLDGGRMSTLMAEREHHRLLFDALRHLCLREQELLELYYWQRLSASEIGKLQDLIEATVRSRIRAALKRLAKIYGELAVETHERDFDSEVVEGWMKEMREQLDEARVLENEA